MPKAKKTAKTESSQKGNFELESKPHSPQGGMRIIAVRTLREFWESHAETEQPLKAWYHEVQKCSWGKADDILNDFPKARPIKNNRCIFNINKNDYRLIIQIHYNRSIVYIRFVGSHSEYDKIDATTI
jgi:mRNA interferase HigB